MFYTQRKLTVNRFIQSTVLKLFHVILLEILGFGLTVNWPLIQLPCTTYCHVVIPTPASFIQGFLFKRYFYIG